MGRRTVRSLNATGPTVGIRRLAVVLVAVALVTYAGVSYYLAARLTRVEREVAATTPASRDLPYDDVVFPARGDDITLSGWLLAGGAPVAAPEGAAAPDRVPGEVSGVSPVATAPAAVIFVHGIQVNRAADHALDLAAALVSRGFTVLLFDLRGHGRSSGESVSGGDHERADVLGAVDFLLARGLEPGRIGLLGNSMGGAISILAAAEEPAIGAVVADSPFADVADMIPLEGERVTGLPAPLIAGFMPGMRLVARLVFDIDIDAIAPERAAAGLDIPLLVIHGTGDTRIPTAHGRRITDAHPGSVLWLVEGVDHVGAFEADPSAYVERVAGFFEQALRAP